MSLLPLYTQECIDTEYWLFDVISVERLIFWLTQICDAAAQLLCDQDVFALQVSVCDGRFPLGAEDLRVQVNEAARYRRRHRQTLCCFHGDSLQVVIKWSILVVVGDEPQLGAGVSGCHVRRHETWESTWYKKARCMSVTSVTGCLFYSCY